MSSTFMTVLATCAACEDGTLRIIQVLVAAFLGILFLQSGLDKVFDSKGNLDYLESHFARSPLKEMVPRMFTTITVLEVAAGLASGSGALLAVFGVTSLAWLGALLANVAILCLFFGQRMAKDYVGAAGLVPYFLLTVAALWVLRV